MKVIRPNCRLHFTADDLQFLVSVLARNSRSGALRQLLSNADILDSMLDEEVLFHAILERIDCFRISSHFYFYVLVRHVLCKTGIEDREVADYIAELLAEFANTNAVHPPLLRGGKSSEYLVDMVAALQKADDEERFMIRAHIGNISLFLTGVFPERIRFRIKMRAAPEFSYYEGLGSASYRAAGHHRLAEKYHVSRVFRILAELFRPARLALNDLSDRLIMLNPPVV